MDSVEELAERATDLRCEELSESEDEDLGDDDYEASAQPASLSDIKLVKKAHRNAIREYAKQRYKHLYEGPLQQKLSVRFKLDGEVQLVSSSTAQKAAKAFSLPAIGLSGQHCILDFVLAERGVFAWFAKGKCLGCSGPVGIKGYETRLVVDSNGKIIILVFLRLECKPGQAPNGKPKDRCE